MKLKNIRFWVAIPFINRTVVNGYYRYMWLCDFEFEGTATYDSQVENKLERITYDVEAVFSQNMDVTLQVRALLGPVEEVPKIHDAIMAYLEKQFNPLAR